MAISMQTEMATAPSSGPPTEAMNPIVNNTTTAALEKNHELLTTITTTTTHPVDQKDPGVGKEDQPTPSGTNVSTDRNHTVTVSVPPVLY